MGLLDRLSLWLGLRSRPAAVLVVGLDNSGKTSILNFLRPAEQRALDVVPTVGFAVERFRCRQVAFTAFDMSGQGKYRHLWEHYYRDAAAVVFVADSADELRLVVARDELGLLLAHPDVHGRPDIPLLLLANKMDVQGALSPVRVSQALGLDDVDDRPWHICASNALTGEGIQEGIEWLASQLRGPKK